MDLALNDILNGLGGFGCNDTLNGDRWPRNLAITIFWMASEGNGFGRFNIWRQNSKLSNDDHAVHECLIPVLEDLEGSMYGAKIRNYQTTITRCMNAWPKFEIIRRRSRGSWMLDPGFIIRFGRFNVWRQIWNLVQVHRGLLIMWNDPRFWMFRGSKSTGKLRFIDANIWIHPEVPLRDEDIW